MANQIHPRKGAAYLRAGACLPRFPGTPFPISDFQHVLTVLPDIALVVDQLVSNDLREIRAVLRLLNNPVPGTASAVDLECVCATRRQRPVRRE